LSLTIVLPQLHHRGSRRGVLEVLFGCPIGLFSDDTCVDGVLDLIWSFLVMGRWG